MQTRFDPRIVWILAPAGFIFIWLFVLTILSYASGWKALARQYRLDLGFDGEIWKWQSGALRWTNFNNCLKIGASSVGLYLAIIPPFSWRCPPLMIPWSEIAVSRRTRFLVKQVCLQLGHELKISFCIRPTLAERLQHAAGAAWPVESIG